MTKHDEVRLAILKAREALLVARDPIVNMGILRKIRRQIRAIEAES